MLRPCGLLAASVVATGAFAQTSSIQITGTVDAAIRHIKNGSLGSNWAVVSGSNATSKLIVRGNEDLGSGLSAGFFLDSTLMSDTGAAGSTAPANQLWDRRSTVQLADARLGEIRLGRDWVPTHLVWSGFDPFTTVGLASANTYRNPVTSRVLGQAFGTGAESTSANPTLRVSNVVEYWLPANLRGVYGSLMVSAKEGGSTAAGFTKGYGWRGGWTDKTINVAAAQYVTRNASGNGKFVDSVVGASYDFQVVAISAALRRWEFGSDRQVNTLVAAAIPAGLGTIKLTYLRADQTGSTPALSANDATLLGVGYVYNLSTRTAVYGTASRISNKGSAIFAISSGPAVSAVPGNPAYFGGQASTGFEFGIRVDI
jgi:predicted porin